MKQGISIIGVCLCMSLGLSPLQAQQHVQEIEKLERNDRFIQGYTQQDGEPDKTHSIPFASEGNSLELAIANPSYAEASEGRSKAIPEVVVEITDIPEWMSFTSTDFVVGSLQAGQETSARFTFHIDGQAPVGRPATLTVTARSGQQVSWEKKITMQVAPPTEFSLDQNYPNPFNPTTTIQYRLPAQMQVTVTVFDVLGREVAVLADGLQEAGTQTLSWDASRLASGLYFYRVVAEGQGGKRHIQNKKMMLIK